MGWLLRCVLVASLAASLGTPLAHGQPAPAVDKSKVKAAKQYVDAGLAAQNTGDYDTAITFYQKAYDLLPHPVLWFNMAQAHRLAGRAEPALALYAKYLAAGATGPQAKIARDMVAELEARKAEEARKATQAREAEEARKAEAAAARRQAEEARRAAAPPPEAARPAVTQPEVKPSEAPPAATRGRALRLSGLTVGAIGVVALGVGIGYGLRASSLSDDLSRRGATYDPAKVDDGHTANRIAIAGLVGGGAALVVGATLYWRGHAQAHDRERLALAPMVSDHSAGLAVAGVLP